MDSLRQSPLRLLCEDQSNIAYVGGAYLIPTHASKTRASPVVRHRQWQKNKIGDPLAHSRMYIRRVEQRWAQHAWVPHTWRSHQLRTQIIWLLASNSSLNFIVSIEQRALHSKVLLWSYIASHHSAWACIEYLSQSNTVTKIHHTEISNGMGSDCQSPRWQASARGNTQLWSSPQWHD